MSRNLSNLYISESFQYLVQESGSYLQTGLGSNLTGSLLITASLAETATSASYATTSSYATQFNVATGLTASGLIYPTTDGTENEVIKTDGAGNLSFGHITTIYETVYAGENLVKTDPVYLSGSVGANPIAYKADAGNAAKSPAVYIMNEALTTGQTGDAIALGLIEGIDLTGYDSGQEVYLAVGGGWTATRPTGSASIQLLGIVTKGGSGGKGFVFNSGEATLPNLTAGYAWVGNASGVPVAVATSSFATSVDTGSLLTTASISDAEITFTKGDASTFSIEVNNVTSSISASHAEFAVTASYATFASGAVDVNGVYTASAVDATITFEKGDTTTFDVTINNVTSSISSSYAATATSASYAVTASFALNAGTTVDTGSLLTTASINDTNITFTKGDGSTFDIVVNNVTSSISASYAATATSASYATFASSSEHADNADYAFAATSASQATRAVTASYATDFEVVGTLTALSASITYLETVYETASVIYSSGSNQFGDASNDTQTLYGTVDVLTGPLNVSGSGVFHNGITGSLDGTATSASYAVSSSQAENATSATSASYALTASYAENAGASSPVINGSGVDSLVQDIYPSNYADGTGSVMLGGKNNIRQTGSQVNDGFVMIGGSGNTLWNVYYPNEGAVMLGGKSNTGYTGTGVTVIGGEQNYADQSWSGVIGGYQNGIDAGQKAFIVGGEHGRIRSNTSAIVGGYYGNIYSYNRYANFIGAGITNNLYGTEASAIVAGDNNQIYDVGGDNGNTYWSVIIGGARNTISSNTRYSGIIASSGSLLSGSAGSISGSVIIGGSSITGSANNTVYVPNLNVSGSITGSGAANLVQNSTDTYATPKINQVVTLTQAEYNAIGTPDDSTLYVISGSTPFNASGFATTGSNNFTGQITGDVSALTPSSNTASLDCSTGNFFTLTLGDGSDTRLEASNITAGQTINLQVTNGAAGTGTISFGTGILQPTGSSYTGTLSANAIDVVSMISFDGSNLLMNSVKNFV